MILMFRIIVIMENLEPGILDGDIEMMEWILKKIMIYSTAMENISDSHRKENGFLIQLRSFRLELTKL